MNTFVVVVVVKLSVFEFWREILFKKITEAWGARHLTCPPPWLCVLLLLLHPVQCELGLMATLRHEFISLVEQDASFW